MDKDIKLALLNNLLLKSKIVIILFGAILLIQIVAISYLVANRLVQKIPTLYLFVIPIFIFSIFSAGGKTSLGPHDMNKSVTNMNNIFLIILLFQLLIV